METSIHYIAKTPNLEKEKAFSTDYPVDHVKGARRKNIEPDHRRVIVAPIKDTKEWKLDVHGFCFLQGAAEIDPEKAYTDKKAVQDAYFQEIETILHDNFPRYTRIECFDLTVRKRDVDYPEKIRIYRSQYEQPSAVVHCDWSTSGAKAVLNHCFPGNESFWEGKRFDLLNVWRPLKAPSEDWPLAVCDYTTIDKENDVLLLDAIRRDRVDEICALHHNASHEWHYLRNQSTNDLLVFRNADSHGTEAKAFHAAVNNPESRDPPRESVEVRVVAIYP
ncbi:putative CmcJ-like methyltransferase [Pestalotiopsis sp. NC0098]|nr:putative CmcJ-like methyltransferase [Pestalotiopsis sp. NC0098]